MPPFFLSIADEATGEVVRQSVEMPSVAHVLTEMDRIERIVAQESAGVRSVSVSARDCAGRTLERRKLRSGTFR